MSVERRDMRTRLPGRFRAAEIAGLENEVFGMVSGYAIGMRINGNIPMGGVNGIMLAGPPGVGKSWAMAALTNEYVKVSWRPDFEFVTSADFFERMAVFGSADSSGDARYDHFRGQFFEKTYATVPWLVINDLGKEYRGGRMTEQVSFLLGRVLRARSEECLPVFITTNLAPSEFAPTYGDSISSLLSEMCRIYVVNGPDLRKEQR